MAAPLRVLHIVGSLGVGGIQSYLMELYRHIDRSKVQFDFVVHIKTERSYASEVEALGGKVFYIDGDAFEKKDWKKYIDFWKQFYKSHPEYHIVHGHLRSTSAIYLREAKKAGRYTIAHSHATSNGYGKSGKVKDLLQFPTRFIADFCMGCSRQANEWMFGRKRANSDTCRVVRNGIDTGKFTYNQQTRNRVRRELGIDEDAFVIGTVGRLVEQKNHKLLIDAFAESYAVKSNSMLIIVGDGPLYERLSKQVSELGLNEQIKLLGSRTDVNELLQAFDAFAMPSKDEGLGIAVVEAQAAGLPVLISPAITDEACITDKVIKVGSYDIDDWSKAVVGLKKNERIDCGSQINNAGYDIQEVSDWLCGFYLRNQ